MSSEQVRRIKVALSQFKGEKSFSTAEQWMEEVTNILTELAADEDIRGDENEFTRHAEISRKI